MFSHKVNKFLISGNDRTKIWAFPKSVILLASVLSWASLQTSAVIWTANAIPNAFISVGI